MAEPTLSVTLDELRREVARFLSFGRDHSGLNATQREDVDSIIRRGLRQFYQPPPVPGHASHQWTFLRPVATVATVAGQESYPLSDDFGGMMGSSLTNASHSLVPGPSFVSDYHYRSFAEGSAVRSGLPVHATVRPRTTLPTRHDLWLFPVPDRALVLQYQYVVAQDAVTAELARPAGAAMHGETILSSCLAIAEEYVVSPTTQYRQLFRERLASSISLDRSTRGGGIIGTMRPTGEDVPPPMPRVTQVRYVGS